jgi:hypothetical protein
MPGRMSGRSTDTSVLAADAPSTAAASDSSQGICRKVLRITNTPNGRLNVVWNSARPVRLLVSPRECISRKSGVSSAWNGIIIVTSTSANTTPDPRKVKRAIYYPFLLHARAALDVAADLRVDGPVISPELPQGACRWPHRVPDLGPFALVDAALRPRNWPHHGGARARPRPRPHLAAPVLHGAEGEGEEDASREEARRRTRARSALGRRSLARR